MRKIKPPPSIDPKDAESIIAQIDASATIINETYKDMPDRTKAMMIHLALSLSHLKKKLTKYE